MNEELQPQGAENLDDNPEDGGQAVVEGGDVNWEAEAKKYKAIADRKAKQLEKVQNSLKEEKPEAKRDIPSASADDKIAELEFKVNHPELKDNIDLIKTLAKGRGITMAEAAKDDLVLSVINANKEKAGASVINSNQRIAPSSSEIGKKLERLRQEGGVDALAEYLAVEE
jgi:5'-3' exonuclease